MYLVQALIVSFESRVPARRNSIGKDADEINDGFYSYRYDQSLARERSNRIDFTGRARNVALQTRVLGLSHALSSGVGFQPAIPTHLLPTHLLPTRLLPTHLLPTRLLPTHPLTTRLREHTTFPLYPEPTVSTARQLPNTNYRPPTGPTRQPFDRMDFWWHCCTKLQPSSTLPIFRANPVQTSIFTVRDTLHL